MADIGYVGERVAPIFDDDGRIDAALLGMVGALADRGQGVIEQNTPVDTGELRSSWYETPPSRVRVGPVRGFEVRVTSDVDYAVFVEHGTGLYGPRHAKYPIRPKVEGGVLRWQDGATGEWRYATEVMHPGSPGQHMVAIGVALVEYEFSTICEPYTEEWAAAQERAGG